MTDKAYIVANEEQELRVLNEFEQRGYCWINDQGKPISSGILIARELEDYPLFIGERFETKTIYWQDLSKLVNEEIAFDGRKEEKMSDKYVVSQEFMNELKEWKDTLDSNDYEYKPLVGWVNLKNLPETVSMWWGDDEVPDEENNNRLIAILRWVNVEDVFEVEKPKKWIVRSKEHDEGGHYQYVIAGDFDMSFNEYHIEHATRFDTEEEAQSWANSHQEVVEVVDV